MRQVNHLVWESLDHGAHTDAVAFFCECAQAGCYRSVWLTPLEYGEFRRRPGWVAIAPTHPQPTTQ